VLDTNEVLMDNEGDAIECIRLPTETGKGVSWGAEAIPSEPVARPGR